MENDELVKALAIGMYFTEKAGRHDEAQILLKLRNIILKDGTPAVWSNGKAFRRYQGQGKFISKKEGYKKYRVIMLEEEIKCQ